jgi:hypothetical protein
MKFQTKLWKRGKGSFATTIPRTALLNLDVENKGYNIIWELDQKANKWCISFEEIS